MAIKVAPQQPRNGQHDPPCFGPAASAALGMACDKHSSPSKHPPAPFTEFSFQRPCLERALQDSLETTQGTPSLLTPGSHLGLDTELPLPPTFGCLDRCAGVEAGAPGASGKEVAGGC